MSIRLHSKFGLNPTLVNCYYCHQPNEILLVGAETKGFKEAGLATADGKMHSTIGVVDRRPCPKCEEWMKKGIIFISVRDDQEQEIIEHRSMPNPYRTGGWCVLTDDAVKRMLNNADDLIKSRFCFVPDTVWDALGLPRTGKSSE